jgi:hypothetical protein
VTDRTGVREMLSERGWIPMGHVDLDENWSSLGFIEVLRGPDLADGARTDGVRVVRCVDQNASEVFIVLNRTAGRRLVEIITRELDL